MRGDDRWSERPRGSGVRAKAVAEGDREIHARVRRRRLRHEHRLDIEPASSTVDRRREDLVTSRRAEGEDAPLALGLGVLEEAFELPDLVPAVGLGGQIVSFDPQAIVLSIDRRGVPAETHSVIAERAKGGRQTRVIFPV
jgi:hypothetical protein